jgi:hypothetical protein
MYPIIVSGALPIPGTGVLAWGGVAGERTYLHFDIPSILVDSVQVIRASLLLNQLQSRVVASSSDSIALLVNPVLAGSQITDIGDDRRFRRLGYEHRIGLGALRAASPGPRSIELVNLFRAWRAVGSQNSNRAFVLRAKQEASSAAEVDFSSTEGGAGDASEAAHHVRAASRLRAP